MSTGNDDSIQSVRYHRLRLNRLQIAEEEAENHIARAVELELYWAPKLSPEHAAKARALAADRRKQAARVLKKAYERHRRGGWE